MFGVEPSEVHMHLRRIPIEEIPSSDSDIAPWLIDAFQLKDQLLTDFITNGHFPNQGTEDELSTFRCMANCAVVLSITGIFTYLTFYSFIFFKVYVGLSCVYLAFVTYFNIRPSPIFCREERSNKKSL